MTYIQGKDRGQLTFLPNSIEDYIDENNPVRVIDAFVDLLDLKALGFEKTRPARTGRPAYDPADLLKLYIYGYMNKIRSSRKLMTECYRNIEVFYLLRELKPDFRTISDFRKDNPKAIKGVFRQFVYFCDQAKLYQKELIAIDGTKVRAQNAADKAYNQDSLEKKLARIDAHIEEYIERLNGNDHAEIKGETEGHHPRNIDKIAAALTDLSKRKEKYQGYLQDLSQTGKTQILETDPDCHRMHTRNGFHCCYNIQTAIDSGSHLICEYEVTKQTNDVGLLTLMAQKTKKILKLDRIETVCDKGYESREDILSAILHGILPNVAMRYDKDESIYNLDYTPAKISDQQRASIKPKDIEQCLKAGILPSCLNGNILSLEVQHPSGISCFTRIDEKQVLCPMGKILRKTKRRHDRQTIFKSREACRTCDNRCTSSNNPKEVSFVDGALYVPVKMRGNKEVKNTLPPNAVFHHNSRSLQRKEMKSKVVLRLRCDKDKLHERMCTAEHPFGTVKWYNDAGYVLCRGKEKVTAEIGLAFLAYNIKRAINIIGTKELIARIGG